MIAFGGFVSLFGLRARDTTEDLDYYFPGVIDAAGNLQTVDYLEDELVICISTVTTRTPDRGEHWANSALEGFLFGADLNRHIQRAFAQNYVLYNSPQLKIYAGSWTLQLAFKLNAIQSREKLVDLTDAAYIARKICIDTGATVVRVSELAAEFQNPPRVADVTEAVIQAVNQRAKQFWGVDVIAM